MKPHKHADLIHAWADGAQIQWKSHYGKWFDEANPHWGDKHTEYRIKPDHIPDHIQYLCFHFNWETTLSKKVPFEEANLKLTFDGESCKLKSAEVIK